MSILFPILIAAAGALRKEILGKGGDAKALVAVARRASKDGSTRRTGGSLGWFTREKMVQELSEAAFALKAGEISKPVKTKFGWHLIYLEEKGDEDGKDRKTGDHDRPR
jgi:parvulin-like peptidyl-prolyl isomerase